MPERTGEAEWTGDLRGGAGTVSLGSDAFTGSYSFASRFEDAEGKAGTNPEELIAAAHAACFSMALANGLSQGGHVPESVHTRATAHLVSTEGGFAINRIDLVTNAVVPGIDEEEFRREAETAKANCPVSKALSAIEITLSAKLG